MAAQGSPAEAVHTVPSQAGALSIRTLGVALVPVLFAYGGWDHVNNVGGELRDGQRTAPRAILVGMAGVVAVYVLANAAYLHVLGVDGLAAEQCPRLGSSPPDARPRRGGT